MVLDIAKVAAAIAVKATKAEALNEFGAAAVDPANEPALSTLFETVLLCASAKDKSVCLAAEEAASSFCKNLTKPGVALALPTVLRVSEECTKWQVKLLCCQVLQTMCRRAPAIYTRHLPTVVPVLSALMWETKKAVKKAATKT